MVQGLSVMSLLLASAAPSMAAPERNMRLTGDGYMESGRSGNRDVREVRLTLRPNNEFAATIFTSAGEYAVKGVWLRRGLDNVERIQINEFFGNRASGDGTLQFGDRDHLRPRRLSLSGNARDGRFSLGDQRPR